MWQNCGELLQRAEGRQAKQLYALCLLTAKLCFDSDFLSMAVQSPEKESFQRTTYYTTWFRSF